MAATLIDEKMWTKINEPVGYLHHEPTKTSISVYKEINIFQRWMLNLCFGLRYEGNKKHPLARGGNRGDAERNGL